MPLSVQVVDQRFHFGTSMPLRVGASIPLLWASSPCGCRSEKTAQPLARQCW